MNGDGGGRSDRLAPVTPLFPRSVAFVVDEETDTHGDGVTFADDEHTDAADAQPTAEQVRAAAESMLIKKLRARSLSTAEARRLLAQAGLGAEGSADVIDDFVRRGYLSDAALAEQLVHSGAGRRGFGRQAVRQLLQKRSVDREVIDAVVAEMPDDDAERAREFATTKARALLRLDDETATRRLMGQLARRGFGGGLAAAVARDALAEARREAGGRAGGGVRFR